MRDDILRWDAKYAAEAARFEAVPEPLLREYRDLLPGRGAALDLAAGLAHNAIHLASLGYDAFALDGSFEGLRRGMAEARRRGLVLHALVADLDHYPLPRDRFAVIVVVRYLNRVLAPAIVRALAPGGVLLYRTFNRRHLQRNPRFNPDFVLADGELPALFARLKIIASDERAEPEGSTSILVARRVPRAPCQTAPA